MRLDQGHDVALGILEPRGPGVTRARDAVSSLELGRVVFLELHATALELGDFPFDVVDLPERLARPRAPGVGRGIHEAPRIAGELVDDAPGSLLLGLEPDFLFVELPRASEVFHWNVGIKRKALQHGDLLGVGASPDRQAPSNEALSLTDSNARRKLRPA